jgi:hypothetical protein
MPERKLKMPALFESTLPPAKEQTSAAPLTEEEVIKATWDKVHPQGLSFLLRTGCLKQMPAGSRPAKLIMTEIGVTADGVEYLVRFDLHDNREVTGTYKDTSIFVYRPGS